MTRASVTAIVLAKNEAVHIERCLRSLRGCVERVVVVDSNSTDQTVELARREGADIYQHPFRNYADQFNWALDQCEISSDWIMRIDSDEFIDDKLAREIQNRLPGLGPQITGIVVERRIKFLGKTIRFGGGVSPQYLLKIWRAGMGRVENRWMDEHTVLANGETVTFGGTLLDDNIKGMTYWVEKHNWYATREMIDYLNSEFRFFSEVELSGSAKEARVKRQMKVGIYNKTPLIYRALLFFLYRYFFRLGFLDGLPGLLFHLMQGLWYRVLVDIKIMEARTFLGRYGVDAFRSMLQERHNIAL